MGRLPGPLKFIGKSRKKGPDLAQKINGGLQFETMCIF